MKLYLRKSFFPLLLLFMVSCDSNRWEVDTEKITIQQQTTRFEFDLFQKAEGGISDAEITELRSIHPKFYPLFVEGVMSFGPVNDPNTVEVLNQFSQNKDLQDLYKKVASSFPLGSLSSEFEQLKTAFKRYHYYFPNRVVPEVYTMIAAFNYATVADDSLLAIGLDTYLGGDYEVYAQIGIPQYKFKNFEKEYIVTDAMKAWLLTEFETEGSQNLLSQMIFHGKSIYLLEAFVPSAKEYLFFNYKAEELIWCEENRGPIWFHFVDMELLFTTEVHQIRKYMGDAPFVAGFPEGSPGRVGQWVGYEIVKAFMNNNKDVSLEDLMNLKDANKILRKSNYKPKR
ncbi:MAG: hypothetical protein JKY48_00900 [Flavobacteriales bacterium]|nr:hypothetical protein [Flavobacteriales bacterium]